MTLHNWVVVLLLSLSFFTDSAISSAADQTKKEGIIERKVTHHMHRPSQHKPKSSHRNEANSLQKKLPLTAQAINNSFANIMNSMMQRSPIMIKNDPEVTLRCEMNNNASSYQINPDITVHLINITSKGFMPTKICIYDSNNTCRGIEHLDVASNVDFLCIFEMTNMVIAPQGTIVEENGRNRPISFGHWSVAGGKDPNYCPVINYMFLKGYDEGLVHVQPPRRIVRANVIFPTRMRYDDVFNHASFQIINFVGLLYEFYPEMMQTIHWHCSKITGALLLLLDIPEKNLIIEKTASPTDKIFLPWVPNWNPIQLSPIYGISRRISKILTDNLVKKQFTHEQLKEVEPIPILNFQLKPFKTVPILQENERYIVYLSRFKGIRSVENEPELLEMLEHALNPQYKLIVLGSIHAYKTHTQSYIAWQQYAKIIQHAKVLFGPHGGAMNNLMFAPDDCELVEFNEWPTVHYYTESHNQVPVRTCFLAAWWAKGGKKYWLISPTKKNSHNFYIGRMRISPLELMSVFSHIANGTLLKPGINISQYPTELRSCFQQNVSLPFSQC